MKAIVPIPKCDVSIRLATMPDLPFLDALQKKYNRALGFFPRKQMEGYLEAQGVLIAQDAASGRALGYCVSRDRYLKRDELGVIFQLCVEPGVQRKLVGAALVQAVFERSAYGCRLYCCWCAQDLEANYFWESMGFAPIAFRGGSTGKKRVHIFWQRRITGDDTTTSWWFPAKTEGGAMREDRLVFPIPPGLHWSDQMPVLQVDKPAPKRIEHSPTTPAGLPQAPTLPQPRRVQFGARPPHPAPAAPPPPAQKSKPRAKPQRAKIDPKYLAATRELRDRYLEHINTTALLPAGKYDVSRQIGVREASPVALPKQLPEAA